MHFEGQMDNTEIKRDLTLECIRNFYCGLRLQKLHLYTAACCNVGLLAERHI